MTAPSAPAGTPAPSGYRFVIYALLLGMNFTLGVAFLGPASLLPLIISDYGISGAAAGFLVASMTLMVTLFSIPAGILAHRWGMRRTCAVAWYLVATGVLTPLLPGFLMLSGLRLIQGLGAAVLLPLIATMLMRWAPAREVPGVNAGSLASLTAGMGISLVAGPPLAEVIGWPGVLGLEGALALLGATLWLLLAREGTGATATAAARPAEILGVFRLRATWLLGIAVMGPWAQFIALSSWLPTYFTEVRGLSLNVAAFTAAVFTAAGIPAAVLGGFLTTRTGRRRPIILWAGLLLSAGGFATFLAPAGLPLYVAVVATGVLQWAYEPALFSIPLELPGATPERAGAITAAMLTAGNASSFIAPVLVGFLWDTTGSYLPGLSLVAVSSATLLVASLFLPETGPNSKRERQRTVPGVGLP
ncbi:MAG: MFS transporter, partial [Chloroflexi bacterium]|nr:MFS transporter [Chloroflexota bacterium]